MTPEQRAKLQAVIDAPGFGTGRAYRMGLLIRVEVTIDHGALQEERDGGR